MWTTLTLLSVLAAAPAETGLSLKHVRSTHGLLGPLRRDETVAPGDILFVCFDIDGIHVDAEGKVRYRMGMELSDAAGKVVFRQAPKEQEVHASLGGDRVPAYAHLSVGLDTPPGDYVMKVVVEDLASARKQSLTRKIKVLARDFALVRTTVTLDEDAHWPLAVFTCGQVVWVHGSAVGFARGRDKQANVVAQMRVLDASGKPTLAKAETGMLDEDLPTKQLGMPFAFLLTLNRPGKFTVELQARDQVSGKKSKMSFPIVVQGAAE
ncbi:MAG TPA: hypothetical protein VMG10_23255 [Gemmataceae bacterium]|nr:hypothetical protein [Gemmataceae bacterium]